MSEIATLSLQCQEAGDARRPLRIAVKAPSWDQNSWRCSVESNSVLVPSITASGSQSVVALAAAMRLLELTLAGLEHSGVRLLDDNGGELERPNAWWRRVSMEDRFPAYDDDFRSCAETYSTLRLVSASLDPDAISAALGLQPTWSGRKGEPISPRVNRIREENQWNLSTEHLTSHDHRRHIEWLLKQITPAAAALERLHAAGVRGDVFTFWSSKTGHRGPIVSASQMRLLGELGFDSVFDLYLDAKSTS
jgi:hypothetical protein